jgi:formate--tetrahydrofolate ligase
MLLLRHLTLLPLLDNHIFRRKSPLFDSRLITWNRVLDMNDRALRDVIIGLGGRINGIPRQSAFHITAASEIMAILCLCQSYNELKESIGKIRLGYTYDDIPVFIKDLGITGAVAAVLKDALMPNLVQTTENTPRFRSRGTFCQYCTGNMLGIFYETCAEAF